MYGDWDARAMCNRLLSRPACVNVDITCDNFHVFPFLSMSCTFLIHVCGHSSPPNVVPCCRVWTIDLINFLSVRNLKISNRMVYWSIGVVGSMIRGVNPND